MAVSKPLAGAQIDRTAPLAQFLRAFWPLNEGGGTRFGDAVGRAVGTGVSGVTWGKGGAVFNGASYITSPVGALYVTNTTKFSAVISFQVTSATDTALMSNMNIGVTKGWEVGFYGATGKVFFATLDTAFVNYLAVDGAASVTDGKVHVLGFDYDGTSTAAGIRLFVDGTAVAMTRTTAGTGNPGAFGDVGVYIGKRADAVISPFGGAVRYAGMWIGTNLGAAGHAAIAANPWQLWPDEPQLVFAPASATTITAAWTEDNETTAATEVSSSSASISWTEANEIAAAAIQSASASSLAWLEENETIAINVLAASDVSEWIITARRRGRR